MPEKKFQFSDLFVRKLVELTEGAVSAAVFEEVLQLLELEANKYHFTSSSEANLLRIFSSVFDRTFFVREMTKYPHHGEIITAIAASSNYLTDICVRNPEFLYQVFDQSYLASEIDYASLEKEIAEGLEKFKSLQTKLNFLRQVKKRFTLKIGLTDLLGLADLLSITRQLSYLAKAINAKLFEQCYTEVLTKYNLDRLNHSYCLCSLGKLGGNELNYSSDVDLILFFDFNESVAGTNKEYHELLAEAALLFIKSSTAISERGYIYRVDFRLRPDGKFSPLCKTLNDYIKYYETRGEDWERQMLIKLDFICGDSGLYKQFFDFTQSYIYKTSFSTSIKEKIKSMKANIERMNAEKDNIKTFIGGIRDIEFTVQALQMLNGGRITSLRTGNTLIGIEGLLERRLLNQDERDILTSSYIFYRRIEHFLQLMNDTQTHIIPDDAVMQNKIARYMSVDSPEELKSAISVYRDEVRKIYNSVLKSEEIETIASNQFEINFKNKEKAEKSLNFLRTGIGLVDRKEFDSRTIDLFNLLEPELSSVLKNTPDPDRTLENFVKIISATKFPSIWYNELSNKKFFQNFLSVCTYSQRAVDILSSSRSFEEFFFSRKVFIKKIDQELADFSPEEILLLLSFQFTLKLINTEKVAKVLTAFVTKRINLLLTDLNLPYNFFVCGLGSYGSESMSFASDIDLIVVADDVENKPDIQKDFQNFLARIKIALKPFDVDFRLRPEGKKSPLVWDIKNYGEYLDKRARVWEFQTLSKTRFVYGDKKLFLAFFAVIALW